RALARAGGDPKQMWCIRRRMIIDGVERNVRVLLWQAQAPEWASERLAEAVLSPCGQYLMTADAFEVFYGPGSLEERRETFRRNFEEKASRPELAAGLALPAHSGLPTMFILALVAFLAYLLSMQLSFSYDASLPIGERVCKVLEYSWTGVLVLGMYLFFGFKNFRAWRARRAAARK
ncbi:MAG: hypothetical protein KDB07_13110, partial [Planctomycetes bacterium]|nr:hypothetical protein [Planctomycetota bacterium]